MSSSWLMELSYHSPLNANALNRKCLWILSAAEKYEHYQSQTGRIWHTFVIGSLCACVCKSECRSMCCLLTHVEVVCRFLSSCSVAWQLSLCFGVPLCWWKWLSTAHTSHIFPSFQNYHPFVSLSCLSIAVFYLHSAHPLNPHLTCWCFFQLKV